MKYIILRNNTYHYRRRTPKLLSDYLPTFIFRTLSSDATTAKALSANITSIINKSIVMVKIGLLPDLDFITQSCKASQPSYDSMSVHELSKAYLKQSDMSAARKSKVSTYLKVITELLPTVTQENLDTLKSNLKLLPKMNIHKYKNVGASNLVKMQIPQEHLLSVKTLNDYIKSINSLLTFAFERGMLKIQHKLKIFKDEVNAREKRNALKKDAVNQLISTAKSAKLASAFTLLYLSGMRLSEAYKCKISMVDGIECFDLTQPTEKLKTSSSYRLIPVHDSIADANLLLADIQSLKSDYISKAANRALSGEKESLYSLRHSFATHLINSQVNSDVVSELMGHAHKTMTLNRYAKGYDVKILCDAVNKLKLEE